MSIKPHKPMYLFFFFFSIIYLINKSTSKKVEPTTSTAKLSLQRNFDVWWVVFIKTGAWQLKSDLFNFFFWQKLLFNTCGDSENKKKLAQILHEKYIHVSNHETIISL
jgi:hypothetical protein